MRTIEKMNYFKSQKVSVTAIMKFVAKASRISDFFIEMSRLGVLAAIFHLLFPNQLLLERFDGLGVKPNRTKAKPFLLR